MATYTQAEIDTLKAAIVSGVLSVTYDGPPRRQVVYQSLSEMRALLAAMRADVAASAGLAMSKRIGTRKGL